MKSSMLGYIIMHINFWSLIEIVWNMIFREKVVFSATGTSKKLVCVQSIVGL